MTARPPAAWHPDPFGRYEMRYWDGNRWTEHVSSGGAHMTDAPEASANPHTAAEVAPPAGWYADPHGRYELRYWDGAEWSDHVFSDGRQSTDGSRGLALSIGPTESGLREPPTASNPEVPPYEAPRSTTLQPMSAPEPGPFPSAPRNRRPPASKPSRKAARLAARFGAAGDSPGRSTLLTENVLVITQRAAVVGNRAEYGVYAQSGEHLGTFREVGHDLANKILDKRHGRTNRNRTYRFELVDPEGAVVLAMSRWEIDSFVSEMGVEDPSGALIGTIAREHTLKGEVAGVAAAAIALAPEMAQRLVGGIRGLAAKSAISGAVVSVSAATDKLDQLAAVRFSLVARGERIGSITSAGNYWGQFSVTDGEGEEVAVINKERRPVRLITTDADNYVLHMHRSLDDPFRSLVLGAAVAIDVALHQS